MVKPKTEVKKEKVEQPNKPKAVVLISCPNNTGMRNEYSVNAMIHLAWVCGAYGIQIIAGTYDEHPICYDDETEILTENGWKLFSNLQKNEKVATCDSNGYLEYQLPTEIISMDYEGEMFQIIKSRKVDLVVTPNHKMFVSKYKSANDWYPFGLTESKEIFDKKVKYKRDALWKGTEQEFFYLPALENNAKRKQHRIPLQIPMNTWLEFFGYWLSEGCTSKYTKNGHYSVIISQFKDSEKREKIRTCIAELFSFDEADFGQFRIHNKQLWNYLKQFGKSHDKFIPRELLKLSPRQLNILLEALMLGDGSSRERIMVGSTNSSLERVYTTTSKQLADDVQEILLKIGISGNIRTRKTKGKQGNFGKANFDELIVSFVYNNEPIVHDNPSDLLKATNVWIDYSGKIYCVKVPNHIIYVRRNGIPVWSGNSVARNMACEEMLKNPKITHLFFVDSDCVPDPDTILKFLSYDLPVVSGWYLSRKGSGLPVVFKLEESTEHKTIPSIVALHDLFPKWRNYKLDELLTLPKDKNGLTKVDGIGAGCLLIKRETLSHLDQPYFFEDNTKKYGFGEDLFFSLNCKVHDIPIFVDLNKFCKHWTFGLIDMRHVQALLQRSKMENQTKNPQT